ncbi:hypothetical protein L5515_008140 [Caenorhabditis briggsae]|uniref:Uncharacterized protein n=2 Tax=Caenorhabditis briggsae TaxID=6238 RepID=A0AAE9F0C8_CAEBR|nr:hypothetical protein L5515_008140 [Caenorhabditis briggsae]
MTVFWIHLLLLVVVVAGKSNLKRPSFPDDLYPANMTRLEFRKKCSLQSNKLDYCILQYKACVGTLTTVRNCNARFCLCTKSTEDDLDEFDEECSQNDACTSVHINGPFYKNIIIEEETKPAMKNIEKHLRPLFEVHQVVAKSCEIELELELAEKKMIEDFNSTTPLLNLTLKLFAIANVELHKTEKCHAALDQYRKVLEDVDTKTAGRIHIPYNLWFVGAEMGPIGRVATRIIADEMCQKSSLEFNHQSVSRVACYDQQDGQKKCDELFYKNVKRTLSMLDSKKIRCQMFVELIETLQSALAAKFYSEAAEYDVDPSTVQIGDKLFEKGFEASEDQSLTQRDTKSIIISLESSTNTTSLRVKQYFEKVSLECGNSRNSADVVASCGYMYANCVRENRKNCQKDLPICLKDIDGMRQSCEHAISKLSDLLWPSSKETRGMVAPVSVDDTEESSWSIMSPTIQWSLFFLGVFAFIAMMVLIIVKTPKTRVTCKKFCGENQTGNDNTLEDHGTLLPSGSEAEIAISSSSDVISSVSDSGISLPSADSEDSGIDINNGNIPIIESALNNNQDTLTSGDIKSEVVSIREFPAVLKSSP